jgi:hypothetical protein
MKPELVTVVYSKEKEIMELQAYSVNQYVTEPCIHWVIVEDYDLYPIDWHGMLSPHYTKHELRLITDTSNIDSWASPDGWIRQQYLKLDIANQINSEYYLILDAKNFFVGPVDLKEWPISEGSPAILELDENWSSFIEYLVTVNDWKCNGCLWGPVTPFRARTSTVKEILDLDVKPIFECIGEISEFLLYSLYVSNTKGKEFKKISLYEGKFHTIWMPEMNLYNNHLQPLAQYPHLILVGIHRRVWEDRKCAIETAFWLLEKGFDEDLIQRCILEKYAKRTYLAQKEDIKTVDKAVKRAYNKRIVSIKERGAKIG